MKKFVWLLIGVVAGIVVGRQLERSEQGNRFFSDIDQKAREFSSAVTEGYRAREAELRRGLGK